MIFSPEETVYPYSETFISKVQVLLECKQILYIQASRRIKYINRYEIIF
jgi:hypothetical protein